MRKYFRKNKVKQKNKSDLPLTTHLSFIRSHPIGMHRQLFRSGKDCDPQMFLSEKLKEETSKSFQKRILDYYQVVIEEPLFVVEPSQIPCVSCASDKKSNKLRGRYVENFECLYFQPIQTTQGNISGAVFPINESLTVLCYYQSSGYVFASKMLNGKLETIGELTFNPKQEGSRRGVVITSNQLNGKEIQHKESYDLFEELLFWPKLFLGWQYTQ